MVPSVRSWIDRHRSAGVPAVTGGFSGTRRESFAASGVGAPWTLSTAVGSGGFEPPVGAAVAAALAFGTERIPAHDVPDPSGLGLTDGDSRSTRSKGTQGIGRDGRG